MRRPSPRHQANALLAERAHAMRAAPTPSEHKLWLAIAGGRAGVVFRRQVPVAGRFIADFLAPAERLILEADGGAHLGRESRDRRRDRVLGRHGYRVLHIDAELVMGDIEQAVALIRAELVSPA